MNTRSILSLALAVALLCLASFTAAQDQSPTPLPITVTPSTVLANQSTILAAIASDWPNLQVVSPNPWTEAAIASVCSNPSSPALYGVTSCSSSGSVTGMSFSLQLGVMSPAIAAVSTLIELEIFGGLTGDFEPSWGNLTNLQRLNLGAAGGLTGTIPDEWAGMKALKYFTLNGASTMTAAPIPAWFADLPELATLSFAQTPLSAPFPAWVANSSSLLSLVYAPSNVDFEPDTLPEDWSGATSFSSLQLVIQADAKTPASGPLPTSWPNSIQVVQVTNWGLSGNLSSSLMSAPLLLTLDLSNNYLTGGFRIPTVGATAPLKTLKLSNNPLGGSLPSDTLQFTKLETLLCDDCELEGDLPDGPSSATASSLTILSLTNNFINGTIPSQWGEIGSGATSLSKLISLLLNNNSISSTIPTSLGNIGSLTQIDLSTNKLTGTIPSDADWATLLASFSVSDNSLNGTVPAVLLNHPLTTLSLNGNDLNLCQNSGAVTSASFQQSVLDCKIYGQSPAECGCAGTWPAKCFEDNVDMPATCPDTPSYSPSYFGTAPTSVTNPATPVAVPSTGATPSNTTVPEDALPVDEPTAAASQTALAIAFPAICLALVSLL